MVSRALAGATLSAALAACAPGITQSNGAKMAEALPFLAAATAAQVAQSVAERNARLNTPLGHPSPGGVNVGACDNDDQYACLSVAGSDEPLPPPAYAFDEAGAPSYVTRFINGVRRLNGASELAVSADLDRFAQAGSDELAEDHRSGQHMAAHRGELPFAESEVQGPADGTSEGPLEDQLGDVLTAMMSEGHGGPHHDAIVDPRWRALGVGVARRNDRTYLTVDFSR